MTMSRTGKQLTRSTSALDTEYNALRRRMSRLRVQQGHLPVADDMDIEPNDEYYSDLLKFWKRHKIYMGKDMMSTITAAQAKKKAKQRGRRKSHEFEDLDLNRKTGKVIAAIEETEEDSHSGEDAVKSSPEGTPKIKKRSVTGHSKLKSEEDPVKSSPEGSPKLNKKKSVTDHSKLNGKVTNSERKRESSAKSTKNSTKIGQSGGKTSVKSTVQRKVSDPSKSKK